MLSLCVDSTLSFTDGGNFCGQIEELNMTDYLAKNVGKWLFPRLAWDQRKRQLRTIMLVFLACASGCGALTIWMMLGRL